MGPGIRRYEIAVAGLASAILVALATQSFLGYDEVFGFVTGGVCVWLVVRQHIWNWPIGLLNNAVFFYLFFDRLLYADMSLQVVFFALGVYGWWNWCRGNHPDAPLRPTKASRTEWILVSAFGVAATIVIQEILLAVNGAAPFWDALTTAMSLAAQYLLSRKRIENWYLWIIADVIYVPLYISRDLPLTAVLYAIFLVMCLIGLSTWMRQYREQVA